jgi:hypothetical protein
MMNEPGATAISRAPQELVNSNFTGDLVDWGSQSAVNGRQSAVSVFQNRTTKADR